MRTVFSVALLATALLAMNVRAADEKADLKPLEEMADKALKAYNEGDWKGFFADYAKSMAALATEQTFKALYTDQAMKNLGKYESKKLLDKETVLAGDFPLLVYEAKFEKAEKVKASFNFTKEDGKFKIMQVRFDKQ